ncbi:MAG: hypothetical protein JO340_03800 [Acidobacteriaceae bacterium]|nr:hypothetical protein [Acidobacteriaceae bacterium]
MKKLIFASPGQVVLEQRDLPSLGKNSVLVRSECSLVSNGTERTAFQGRFGVGTHWERWVQYPFSPGYATAGTVLEIGPNVSLVKVGERVALRAPHASHHVVAEGACIPIPGPVSPEDAVWFALSKIAFSGAWAAELKLGASVAIIGAGPVAQMLVRWVAGGLPATLGILAKDRVRLERAKSGGMVVTIEGRTEEISAAQLEKALGGRPQVIFDCTADPGVLSWALGAIADYGKVVLLGDPAMPNERRLTPDVLLRSISITGVHDRSTFGRWNTQTISKLFFKRLREGSFSVGGLCTHVFAPEEAPQAYALLDNSGAAGVLGIRFDW